MGIFSPCKNTLILQVVSVFHLYPMSVHLLMAVFLRSNGLSSGSMKHWAHSAGRMIHVRLCVSERF